MANEAVINQLWGNPKGEALNWGCDSGVAIEKGTLLWFGTDMKISGANTTGAPFAGVAAAEKVAAETTPTISVYSKGIFDMTCGAAITAGDLVFLSGQNKIHTLAKGNIGSYHLSGGWLVGKALKTGAAAGIIQVKLGM